VVTSAAWRIVASAPGEVTDAVGPVTLQSASKDLCHNDLTVREWQTRLPNGNLEWDSVVLCASTVV